MDDYELFEQIDREGAADVECTGCGRAARVEPDCDCECPECDDGRLVSPLVTAGLM